MNLGDRVKVKDEANVDFTHRGRTGSVIADTVDGEPIRALGAITAFSKHR
jgi:hypothetical protein